jgi:hypothetical protein
VQIGGHDGRDEDSEPRIVRIPSRPGKTDS